MENAAAATRWRNPPRLVAPHSVANAAGAGIDPSGDAPVPKSLARNKLAAGFERGSSIDYHADHFFIKSFHRLINIRCKRIDLIVLRCARRERIEELARRHIS